jgi:hypothetical protein
MFLAHNAAMRALLRLAPVLASLLACTSSPATPPVDASTPTDLANDLGAADAPGDDAADVPAPPPWPHVLAPARVMGEARGLRATRAIIHAHSVHSHDACDGNPYVDGGVNEPCLQSFRRSVCADKIDVVFLTEHSGHMSEGSFERVMQVRPGDEPLMEDGALVGYRIACADGHRTMLLPGAENGLMPLGLRRHPDLVEGSLDRAYDATDLAALQRFRAAGALVAIPHVEQMSLAWLRERQPDVLEIYNVHANIDPRIALVHLGYNPGPALVDLLRFRSLPGVDPDMAFLTFFQESGNDLQKWATLLAEGSHIPGIAASDAHENAIPAVLPDGERGDSYRRVFRWFSNELLVRGELTRASAMDALREGRVFVAFEAFGTPVGFSFTARAGDAVSDIGARITLASTPTLEAVAPAVNELRPELPRPTVRVRILRAERDGRWTEVAAGDSRATFTPTQTGAYRAEVRINPAHLRPYLPELERLVREVPWVYSSAIYVE